MQGQVQSNITSTVCNSDGTCITTMCINNELCRTVKSNSTTCTSEDNSTTNQNNTKPLIGLPGQIIWCRKFLVVNYCPKALSRTRSFFAWDYTDICFNYFVVFLFSPVTYDAKIDSFKFAHLTSSALVVIIIRRLKLSNVPPFGCLVLQIFDIL